MSTLRLCCALGVVLAVSASRAEAQGYAAQGYDQQQYPQQPQYQQQPQQQQQYQQQYPQQQYPQQQPPPGYFPTPDAQGSYNYQQQYAPGAYPGQQGAPGQEAAQADEQAGVTSVKGAIQLGAGIALLQHSSLSYSQTSAPMMAPVAPGAPPPAAAAQTWPIGTYSEHPLSLEGGYGITPNILLGALVQLASASEKLEANGGSASVSSMSFTFAPKLDYQFSPTSRVNPFLGAALSITLNNKRFGPSADSQTLFGGAVRAGVRFFVLDQLSIDPILSLGYRTGSGTQKTDAVPAAIEFKNSLSNFLFALSLGVSLWIK